jgi:hypothetical protein
MDQYGSGRRPVWIEVRRESRGKWLGDITSGSFRKNTAWWLIFLWLTYPTSIAVRAEQNLSGVWKRNCVDNFGLLIEGAGGEFYTVTFCGLRACSRDWTPKTKIVSDPKYRIISPDELGVRRSDESKSFFVYRRCPADPAMMLRLSGASDI